MLELRDNLFLKDLKKNSQGSWFVLLNLIEEMVLFLEKV